MAFPVVEATNTSQVSSNITDHIVNLPASIQAGELLVVLFAVDGAPAVTFPEGWTKFFELAQATNVKLVAAYRVADGEEGATITVTTDAGQQSSHISFRISGYSGTPECSSGASGLSQYPDPDALTPSWGEDDVLWLAFLGMDTDKSVSSYPANYTDGQSVVGTSAGATAAVARRERTAASEDPSSFTMSGADQFVAATIGIKPTGGITHEASITFAGAATMTISAVMTYAASIVFAGVGTLSINGQIGEIVYGSISFSGAGALSINAVMTYGGKVTFSGEGSLVIFGGFILSTSITFGGEGTLSILGGLLLKAKMFMLGRGILSINGVLTLAAAISFSGEGFLTIKGRYLGALFVECITTHYRGVEVLTTHNKQVEALTTHNKQIDSKITGG